MNGDEWRGQIALFGVRLERRMVQLGLRRCDLAVRAGIPTVRIRRLICGEMKLGPTLVEIETLARVLSCRPEWLAFGVTR